MSKTALSSQLSKLAAFVAVMVAMAMPLRASGVAVQQAALGLALLGALVLVGLNANVRRAFKAALAPPQARIIAAVFVAWAITVPFSHAPLGSLEIGMRGGLFVLAATLIWAVLREYDGAQQLLWKVLIVTSIGLAVLALLSLNGVHGIITVLKAQSYLAERPHIIFKAFAATSMCLIPVVAWMGRKLDGPWRWWGYSFAPLALMVMVQTHNRSALAGFMAMTIAGALLLTLARQKHARALLATVGAGATGIVAWVAIKEITSIDNIANAPSGTAQPDAYLPFWLLDPHRQNIWKFVFERFLDHPWVGNGIDQINRLPGAKMPVPGLDASAALVPSHPHNWALEILAETGLIGFLPLVFALAFVAWKLIQRYLQDENEADLALLTLMAGFWASALFNFSIWATWWQLTFVVLFAVVASAREHA